ncbi:hypothetical protein [Lachnospira multipara]|uniref:hypothetical protein n=1 Tax=Lachnospira multipara TaxID=28051 RepID=UPI00047FA39D|nr:hypothetical protein [Lachnospira multipara]
MAKDIVLRLSCDLEQTKFDFQDCETEEDVMDTLIYELYNINQQTGNGLKVIESKVVESGNLATPRKNHDLATAITDPDELVKMIVNDYHNDCVEFNTSFFEPYAICMTAQQLLTAYEELQHELNGDYVVCLKKATITFEQGKMVHITGLSTDIDDNYSMFKDIRIEGNAQDELERLLDANKYLIFRFDDYSDDGNIVITNGDEILCNY